MIKYILISSIFLTGCSSTLEKSEIIVDNRNKQQYVFPDKELRELCKDLPELKGKKFADLYKYSSVDIPNIYYDCAQKHKELSEWIDRFEKDIKSN